MEQQEIIEGNKLIAEFMNYHKVELTKWDFFGSETKYNFPMMDYYTGIDDAKFNSSWEWLMPVIEKIEDMVHFVEHGIEHKFTVEIKRKTCYIPNVFFEKGKEILKVGETKNEATWLAVIDFIRWYNEKKKP